MLNIIIAGGWVVVPLIALSVIAIAIIMERAWFMRTERLLHTSWFNTIWLDIKRENLSTQQIKNMLTKGATGRIVYALLQSNNSLEKLDDLFVLEASQLKQNLHRFLSMLGTIAVLSPLLGLLGTVLGMIDIFADLMTSNNPAELSGGISKALISTAIGLIIAIPATFFHRVFARKSDAILAELEHQYLRIRDLLRP